MTAEDIKEVWAELNRLSDELNDLRVRREALVQHVDELKTLGSDLHESQARVERMAQEVEGLIEKGGTDE